MLRGTYLEIDLNALESNINFIKSTLPEKCSILLPIKADAYGHGIVQVGKFLQQRNLVHMLGVASLLEAIQLREAGITLPILILSLIIPEKENIDVILDNNLIQTVADISTAEKINQEGRKRNIRARVHLKVDSGMGRIGCPPEEAISIAKSIDNMTNLELEGFYTHMPVSDERDNPFNQKQISIFKGLINELKENHIDIKIIHMANSAAIVNFPEVHFDMVRPGIMAYGYNPTDDNFDSRALTPVMSFKTNIVFIKRVDEDTPLSYGHSYKTEKPCNLATIPVGYGDGYSRFLSNKGYVIIRDKKYPVVGRVCMDQVIINLFDDLYPVGEEVILFGQHGITAATIASEIGTISYEVTCGISKRVPRIYK